MFLLLLLLLQLLMGTGYACLCSLLLLPITFETQTILTAYYYTTLYFFGFIGLVYNIMCSCFVILAYAMYNDTKNYEDFCCLCDMIIKENKYYNILKPYLNKLRTYIIYINEFMYYFLTLVKTYTKNYKYCKYVYDLYDNIFTINNEIVLNINISKDDKEEIININNIMNNLSNKEKQDLEDFGKKLFSHKNMQKLVNQFEKSFYKI